MDVYKLCNICKKPQKKLKDGHCLECKPKPKKRRLKRLTLISMMAKAEGCCCEAKFCEKLNEEETKKAEARLGVSRRTLNDWKWKFFFRKISCSGRPDCQGLYPPHGTLTEDKH